MPVRPAARGAPFDGQGGRNNEAVEHSSAGPIALTVLPTRGRVVPVVSQTSTAASVTLMGDSLACINSTPASRFGTGSSGAPWWVYALLALAALGVGGLIATLARRGRAR